jgi:hypothetical protein
MHTTPPIASTIRSCSKNDAFKREIDTNRAAIVRSRRPRSRVSPGAARAKRRDQQWRCLRQGNRNDHVFNKPKKHSFLQVISMATHWIRMWSYLQQEEQREEMDFGCNRLEMVARDLLHRCGWRLHNRLTSWCIIKLVLSFVGWFMLPTCVISDVELLNIGVMKHIIS